MIGTLEKTPQLDIFREPLKYQLSKDDDLVQMAADIDWDKIISELSVHYSPDRGRKAIPVRKLAGLLILKKIYDFSDESILKQYPENPSFQYFCGEIYPRISPPASRSELVKFRKRIGAKGLQVIFYPELLNQINRLKARNENDTSTRYSAWNIASLFRRIFHPGEE